MGLGPTRMLGKPHSQLPLTAKTWPIVANQEVSLLMTTKQLGIMKEGIWSFGPHGSCLLSPAFPLLQSLAASPFLVVQLILQSYLPKHAVFSQLLGLGLGLFDLCLTNVMQECPFRDQSHLGLRSPGWTDPKHDLYQRPVPWPSVDARLWR